MEIKQKKVEYEYSVNNKIYPPLILKWLCKIFCYENYPHSFKDQFITWGITSDKIIIGFDQRQEEHRKLLSLIHPRFLGIPQNNTLKIVNVNNFYLDLNTIIHIKYPDIISFVLVDETKHRGGTGGWYSADDVFYTYDWIVNLSDGTSIPYHNQIKDMDMKKGDYVYNKRIQERAFMEFLKTQ